MLELAVLLPPIDCTFFYPPPSPSSAVDVAEIYSPPRVGGEAARFGLKAGEAMDLITGWDFDRLEDRERAEEYVRREKPFILIGSPMCTMFSQLQTLTPWTNEKQMAYEKARRHLQFVMPLYSLQIEAGRLFLHEHPAWGKLVEVRGGAEGAQGRRSKDN